MHGKTKVVVLGGAGFLGSNICLRLLNKGHEVICIDNLSTGCKKNMMEFLFNPLFHFIVHDITTPISISGIDVVIHCALPDLRDPLHLIKTASYGAFTAAGIARRNNAKLICLSSNKAYGENSDVLSEDTKDINNPDLITMSINTMESIIRNYSSLDIRIIRLYDVYGPKMNPTQFIYDSLRKIQKKENLILPYHPSSEICSCFIDDVVDAVCCSMEMKKTAEVLNIGSDNSIDLESFLKIAMDIEGYKNDITYMFKDDSYIKKLGRLSNCSLANDVLKWKQKVDYRKGIEKLLSFIKLGPDRDYEKVG